MATAQSISRLLNTKFERSRTIQYRITSAATYGFEVKKNYKGQVVIRVNIGRDHDLLHSKLTTIELIAEFLAEKNYTVEVDRNQFYPIVIK